MKKQFTIFLCLLFMPLFNVNATSGACSWHNGVNCDAGWQADGRVYCNDGWTDSMVYYDYTVKCGAEEKFAPECVDYINGKDKYLKEINSLIDKTKEKIVYMDTSNPYTKKNMDNYMDYLYLLRDRQISRYNDIAKICTDDIKKKEQQYLNSQNKKNQVDQFYLAPDELCKNNYGQYSYYTNTQGENGSYICDCVSGYEWSADRTTCVKKNDYAIENKSDSEKQNSDLIFDELNKTAYALGNSINDFKNRMNVIKCDPGYNLSLNKKKCIKIPEHAHAVDSPTDVWLCDEGYREEKSKCVLQIAEENMNDNTLNNQNDNLIVTDEKFSMSVLDNNTDKNNDKPSENVNVKENNAVEPKNTGIASKLKNIFIKIFSWFK